MTIDTLIDDVFVKEGDIYAEPPHIDQPTGRGGITLGTLNDYFHTVSPLGKPATITDLRLLSHENARSVIRWKMDSLSVGEGFGNVPFEPLRLQLLDFAYNSGPSLAIRWLQRVLQVPRTGKMDAQTRQTLDASPVFLVHQAYLAARLEMIDRWTDAPPNKQWEEGLENRALSFSLLKVP